MKNKMDDLADSFVRTDTAAIRGDVRRLGSVRAAAKYCSEMSAGQPDWEALASQEGEIALEQSINATLND